MHELVSLDKFDLAIRIVGLAGLPLGVVMGAILGRLRRHSGWYVSRGAALGLLGPILYGVWCYYRWTVRLDPHSGYIGLHKFSTLLINLAVFVVVGIILGLIYRRILHRPGESGDEHLIGE